MDESVIRQCKAAGGRIVKGKCSFTAPKSKLSSSFTLNVGGTDIKKTALWIFIGTISLAAIIGIFALLGRWGETQSKILLTTLLIGGFGLLTIANFALFYKRSKRILYLLAGLMVIGLITTLLQIWEIGAIDFGKMWATIGIELVFGLIAIASYTLMDKQKVLSWVGVVCANLASLSVWNLIWEWHIFWDCSGLTCRLAEGYTKVMIDLIILSVLFAHIALIFLINPSKKVVRTMQWVTVGLASVTALILIILIHSTDLITSWENWWRLIGIIGILNVASTIITPVLNKIK